VRRLPGRLVRPPACAAADGFAAMELVETWLMPRPVGLPDGYVAYNPSGLVVEDGQVVVLLRVEPNITDHLGRTRSVAYVVDLADPTARPERHQSRACLVGEDPAIQRVFDGGGRWWVSTVVAEPDPRFPGGVNFATWYWVVDRLADLHTDLRPTALGAFRMKDVRVGHVAPESPALVAFGRPQPHPDRGTITVVDLDSVWAMDAHTMAGGRIVDPDLHPFWPADPAAVTKGAANHAVYVDDRLTLILGHRAWRTGADLCGRHYEAVLYGYHRRQQTLTMLGTLATRADFAGQGAKNDLLDLSDVVFSGGFAQDERGRLRPLAVDGDHEVHAVTFGLSDAEWGIGLVRCRRGYLSRGAPPVATTATVPA
jgi:hypothetical protein